MSCGSLAFDEEIGIIDEHMKARCMNRLRALYTCAGNPFHRCHVIDLWLVEVIGDFETPNE